MSDAPPPHRPLRPGDHLFLVDGSSFVFRAYFQSMNQDRKYNARSDGLPTGAVRLFCTKLLQFLRDGAAGVKPTHLAIVFDKSERSFRKDIYPDYKAHRPPPPEDLIPQFPLMRRAVEAFGLKPVELEGYEADDLIATYAREAREAGADVLIVSADKDLMQLIRPGVAMYDPASGDERKGSFRAERFIGPDEVVAYFGVPPAKVVDVQALAGDATDNVPGVRGIGIKTAAALIEEFGDLETLLARAAEIRQPKRRESLIENAELARISKRLVTLDDHVATPVPVGDFALGALDPTKLVAFLKAMEFTTITRRVGELYGVDVAAVAPADVPMTDWPPAGATPADPADPAGGAPAKATSLPSPPVAVVSGAARTPADFVAERRARATAAPIDTGAYETVTSLERLDWWIAGARERRRVAFDTETTSLDPVAAELVGISLALEPGLACYIPVGHTEAVEVAAPADGTTGDLFAREPAAQTVAEERLVAGQLPLAEMLARLKPLLADPSVLKIGQNVKYDAVVLAGYGLTVAPYDDTMLISYALDGGRGGHGLDELSERHLGHKPIAFKDVAGSGKSFIGFARVSLDRATAYGAEDADVALRLWLVLKPRLVAEGMTTVYETLERPMVAVLGAMERRGITIDRQILSRLSGEFAQVMGRIEAEIQEIAGEPFNIGSPKQLGEILFDRMGLPGGKKTKTGAWGTGADVLEELAAQGHALPAKILEWRQVQKLRSTYTDALPSFVNRATGRVHTSYALAATTTGRLSSSEPNLQNIPVRTEAGRKIRTAFVAPPGRRLLSADYSQIELRVLAHIADIPQLKAAFAEGLDIHAMTASEMFGVPIEGMDPMIRRRAKAINFGIIYGISAFGLANQLSIGREEAGAYIRRYFERFPGIRDYMEETKRFVHANGYVATIFGRKAHYPEIDTKNPSMRAFLERAAINAPIQGSAADIIRRAMARMDAALAAAGLGAQMLLQVHDELVFELDEAEVERAIPVIRAVMETAAAPAVTLSVPLEVDARAAANWEEAH